MKGLMMNHVPLDKMWLVSRMPIFIVTINSTNYILPFPPPELSTQSHLQPMDRFKWLGCMHELFLNSIVLGGLLNFNSTGNI